MSLLAAVGSGSLKRIGELIEDGADVDEPGIDGTTPLCCAAMWGVTKAAELLLDSGAEVNAGSPGTGATALHLAAFQSQGKVSMLLLAAGADPLLEDKSGRTPADYASVSEAIWPLFAAKGCKRSSKERLLRLGIIRKQMEKQVVGRNAAATKEGGSDGKTVDYVSRPGSSYGRSRDANPLARSSGVGGGGGGGGVGNGGSGGGAGGDVLAAIGKGGQVERRRNESIGRLGL